MPVTPGFAAEHRLHGHAAAVRNIEQGRATSGFHFDKAIMAGQGFTNLTPQDQPDPCGRFRVFDPVTQRCVFGLGSQPGPDVPAGDAVMGRYGAALTPTLEVRQTRQCLPGMVLGNDGLCYSRRDLKNSEREYPKGRAPLLTGGERNCITKASRAAKKIERTTKALQKMGMLKKPSSKTRPAPRRLALPPAGTSIINVE